jgi:hypothetical protein
MNGASRSLRTAVERLVSEGIRGAPRSRCRQPEPVADAKMLIPASGSGRRHVWRVRAQPGAQRSVDPVDGVGRGSFAQAGTDLRLQDEPPRRPTRQIGRCAGPAVIAADGDVEERPAAAGTHAHAGSSTTPAGGSRTPLAAVPLLGTTATCCPRLPQCCLPRGMGRQALREARCLYPAGSTSSGMTRATPGRFPNRRSMEGDHHAGFGGPPRGFQ